MKVKDLYWAARNSTFFINLESESLTDNVLKQHYIDALSNADQLVVVPDGADTLVQTK